MTIFFCKGLTRNPEMRNTPVWVLPNIWRLGQVIDTKFGTNVSNIMYAAKFQGYSFYHFWVIKGKLTGGVKLPPLHLLPPPSTQINENVLDQKCLNKHFCVSVSFQRILKKKLYHVLSSQSSSWTQHALFLFQLFFYPLYCSLNFSLLL